MFTSTYSFKENRGITFTSGSKWFSRWFSSTPRSQAGQQWRLSHGLSRSGNQEGPLHDLLDFKYPDGTYCKPSKGSHKLKLRKEREQKRIESLKQSLENDIRNGNWQQFY